VERARGADHRRLVLTGGDTWASASDVVLGGGEEAGEGDGPPAQAPIALLPRGGWAGSVIAAIAQSYGGGGGGGHHAAPAPAPAATATAAATGAAATPPRPPLPLPLPAQPLPAAASPSAGAALARQTPARGASSSMGAAAGYYYPVHPSALYDASRALLQLVWRGYGLTPAPAPAPANAGAANAGDGAGAGAGAADSLAGLGADGSAAGRMADLLRVAQHVDELEDRNAILAAERDQARALGEWGREGGGEREGERGRGREGGSSALRYSQYH
jgi:hypothetical protein